MRVQDLMSRQPRVVRSLDRLDAAARLMWDHDCGFAPVVDAHGVLLGVLTDRDLCMAAYTQGRPLAEIAASTAMGRVVRTCRPEDSLATALATLQQAQVHRLPVVDAGGTVVGVLALSDVVRAAAADPASIDGAAVLRTLAAVAAPRHTVTIAAPPVAPVTPPAAAAPAPAAPAAKTVTAPAPPKSIRAAKGRAKGKKG